MDEADDFINQAYPPGKPYRDPALELGALDRWWNPPKPRQEARNYNPHRPADAMAPVSEMLSPTMGAYSMGALGTEAILDAYRGKYNPETLAPLAAAALPVPGAKRTLPMDMESRLARAKQMGFRDDVYHHGTTHQFDAFADPLKSDKYWKENYHGPAIYMSSSPDDALSNYAGVSGPDMKNKLGQTV